MDHGHIGFVRAEPSLHISAEGQHHRQRGRAMVEERVPHCVAEDTVAGILWLRAKIVDPEIVSVSPAEEAQDLPSRVPVSSHEASSREAHGHEAAGDIGQVKVKAVPHVTRPPTCHCSSQGAEEASLARPRGQALLLRRRLAPPAGHRRLHLDHGLLLQHRFRCLCRLRRCLLRRCLAALRCKRPKQLCCALAAIAATAPILLGRAPPL
mmetsp:Transcript_76874/g.170300  ORF Transcript_76874/g.170300 Transcript_76874/m.170300 type:complete len:209 (-) Transcript_76874:364-990(-)